MHRRHTGPLNRSLLTIGGLILVLIGAGGLAVGTGVLDDLALPASIRSLTPPRHGLLVGDQVHRVIDDRTVAAVVLLIGVLIGLAGLAWLVFQLPRRLPSPVFRLHDDARDGVITCDSTVIASAIAERARQLPGVLNTSISISGTTRHAELSVDLEVDNRAEVAGVAASAVDRIRSDFRAALGSEIEHLTVRLDTGTVPVSSHVAVLTSTGPAARPSWARTG